MRRRQAADILFRLSGLTHEAGVKKSQLLTALHRLPTEYFIADDWYLILKQVTQGLLSNRQELKGIFPTHLDSLLSNLQNRFICCQT